MSRSYRKYRKRSVLTSGQGATWLIGIASSRIGRTLVERNGDVAAATRYFHTFQHHVDVGRDGDQGAMRGVSDERSFLVVGHMHGALLHLVVKLDVRD